MVLKGIKFRMYPTEDQCILIAKTLGCCRKVYNLALDYCDGLLKDGKHISYASMCNFLTGLKGQQEYQYLREVDSVALQQSEKDLDCAFKNLFAKRAKSPKFKSKKDNRQSYRTMQVNNNIRIDGKFLRLPKLGLVKIKQTIWGFGRIHSVTVTRTPSGKYYATLLVDFEHHKVENAGGAVGIDVGLKEFYTDSNGNTVESPKFFRKSQRKLAREQRRLSKKQDGSKNREKQRIKLARAYEKVTSQRTDFLQKQSTKLIRENQVICIEDLKIQGMLKNHKLAKSIQDASWGTFKQLLEYKARWNGNVVIKVPTFYPSSQTCSCCWYKNPLVKNLGVRNWECPQCHTVHDRDHNAAVNILSKGIEILATMNP